MEGMTTLPLNQDALFHTVTSHRSANKNDTITDCVLGAQFHVDMDFDHSTKYSYKNEDGPSSQV
jgi:hypothetical protein